MIFFNNYVKSMLNCAINSTLLSPTRIMRKYYVTLIHIFSCLNSKTLCCMPSTDLKQLKSCLSVFYIPDSLTCE